MPRKKIVKIEKYKAGEFTKYRFQIRLSTGPTRRSGFDSEDEAEAAYYNLRQQDLKGLIKSKSATTKYSDLYLKWLKRYKNEVRESTFRKTEQIFEDHILPIFGNKVISKITVDDCQEALDIWVSKLYKFSSVKAYANKIFKDALRYELIYKNPMDFVDVPKKTQHRQEVKNNRKEKNFFELHELNDFLNLAKKDFGIRIFTFFWLLAYSGMRRGEILALEWKDIDFKNKTLTINKGLSYDNSKTVVNPTKTGISRTIDLDDETIEVLKNWKYILNHQTEVISIEKNKPIFEGRDNKYLSITTPQRWLKSIIKAGGFRDISLHGFRHTHATLLFDMNEKITPKDVQERLGHTDSSITMDVYEHATDNSKDKIISALNEMHKSS